MTRDEMKQATKEAIKEWLNEQFLAFGKFSFWTIAAAALCALLYFILKTNGWSIAQTTVGR
jgi:hypothetical protein